MKSCNTQTMRVSEIRSKSVTITMHHPTKNKAENSSADTTAVLSGPSCFVFHVNSAQQGVAATLQNHYILFLGIMVSCDNRAG